MFRDEQVFPEIRNRLLYLSTFNKSSKMGNSCGCNDGMKGGEVGEVELNINEPLTPERAKKEWLSMNGLKNPKDIEIKLPHGTVKLETMPEITNPKV